MFTRLLLLGLICLALPAQSATVFTTLFSTNSSWRFLRGTNEASLPDTTGWRSPAFSDTGFTDAPAPFWYGDVRPGGTQLTDMLNGYTCIFLRKNFTVNNAAQIGGLRLSYFVDDGFVAWINGQRVFGENVTDLAPTTNTLAANQPIDPAPMVSTTNTSIAGLLHDGVNTIAIQAFNTSATSSDFGFDCMLESITSETVPPTIASVSPSPGSAVTSLSQVTVTFSEPVVGVTADDLLVDTQPAFAVSGSGTTYTFSFTPPPYGAVGFTWFPVNGITDVALPPNPFDSTGPGAEWEYIFFDTTPPAVDNLFPSPGSTVRALTQLEVTFSEEVNGVNAADLLINGQPATNVTRPPAGPYIFQFPQPATGPVNVQWANNHGIVDQAGTPNAFAGGAWSYVLDPNAGSGDLVITEFMASNQNGLLDEDASAEDWIEIYNRGSTAANLAGWSLSDDSETPGRWVFPSRTLAAGQYLIVFASGKDRGSATPTSPLHTSFRLSSAGGFLGLYNADSPRTLISSYSNVPEQRNDHSYGLDPGGNARYFATPTPGAPNGFSSIYGVAESVHFNVTRGHFSQPFDLILTSPTPGATVRYRLDGIEPTAATGLPYINPLRITNTTLLRAAAFRTNLLPSRTETHSYFFNLPVAQRTLPVLSVVTAVSNMVGRSGIIGMGGGGRASDGLFITNNPATDYHNPSAHGIAWERPVSAEYILPQDNSGFQIDAGIRVQGSDWQRPRTLPTHKFSYRLYFRADYGQAQLNYPLFPNTTVQSFDQIVVRAGYNDNSNPFIRDETVRRLSHDMGQPAAHGGFFLLFTNGGFAGYYNPTERVHSGMMQSQLGGGSEWDVVAPDFATSSEGLGVVDGDRNNFNNFMTNVWSGSALRPVTNQAHYLRIAAQLDLANFADYCLLNAYAAMGDWPANNWRAARERGNTNAMWRFVVWDAEWGNGFDAHDINTDSFALSGTGTLDAGLNSTGNSEIARLYQALRQNREFRLLLADRIQKHFFNGGALTAANVTNRVEQMRRELASVVNITDTEFLSWGRNRLPPLFTQFNTYGLYGFSNSLYGVFASSNAPAFNRHGGPVVPGFVLSMNAPLAGSAIYYTTDGSDPRVPFTGAVSPTAVSYNGPFALGQSARICTRALWQGTNWSALNEADFAVATLGIPLRVTELHYNPTNAGHEFLELQNIGGSSIDLGGMTFEGITFTFGVGASIAPGARMVLVSDFSPTAFASRYPGVTVFGNYGGSLNNGGERLALKDRNGNYIFTVDYNDDSGWPTTPDGGGTSLELTDIYGDPDDPANWHASTSPGGSPGSANFEAASAVLVRINEVLAENGGVVNHEGTFPDFIELYNPELSPINLAGWSLTEGGNARKFVFPATGSTIPGRGYLMVWCDSNTNTTSGLHAGFDLNRSGDTIILYDATTNRYDTFTYGLQLTNYSVGLFYEPEHDLEPRRLLFTPSPNAENVFPTPLAPTASLSINEWQASAPAGQSDWIELHNTAAQPVALRGCFLSTSTAVHRITSLSFVPAFGFVQLFADEGVGPDHLDFRLPAGGETIVLSDTTATEIDRVTYFSAVEGLTRGRLPDGSVNFMNFPGSSSPGASNYVNTHSGPVINEVLARNRSAVTNLGDAADYIELFNPNAAPFSLAGMSLSVNLPDSGQFIFPITASIPANGHLVIWCDSSREPSFLGGELNNTGRSLDGESGGVYLFNAQGQLVNSVEYGFQVIDRPIGLSGGQWRLLASATPGAANAAPTALGTNSVVRINEWMANPVNGADWFELFNPTNLPVELSGLYLTDDPSNAGQRQFRVAPLSFIGPAGFVQWMADADADQGRNHVNFSLNSEGESLWLFRSINGTNFTLIDSVAFDTQAFGISEGRLPDGAANIVPFTDSATPGESNYLPLPGVVINEVLTHAARPLEQLVELRNVGASPVGIGGWYLSDSQEDFKKYRLPDGMSIASAGFTVLYQDNGFAAGLPTAFTFNSAHGGEVWLSAADAAGNLTGYRANAKFGAAEDGVSFGRVTTTLGVDYAALSARSPGAANASPQIGPLVINEIMYNPTNTAEEYIELRNVSASPVQWARVDAQFPTTTNTWRVTGGVDFSFPITSPQSSTIAAGTYVLIVGFNPGDTAALAAFRTRYNIPINVPVFGPFTGRLGNEGDDINLLKPDATQPVGSSDAGFVPYVLMDKVNYNDKAPWPAGDVDGGGLSLQRQGNSTYGNEPLNWRASAPTPGAANGTGVVPAPTITSSPANQNVVEGNAANLQVAANGSAPFSYQWRFNGTRLPGATNASFAFDYVVLENDGAYDCIVSNPGGAAVSAAARLSVQAPAVVLVPPTSVTNRAGSNIMFTVSARGTAPLRYQWRLNGLALAGETNATLVRTNIQSADDGEYDVVVSNPVNAAMATARLTVLINPAIIVPPATPLTVVTSSFFTVSVTATGNPLPFSYEWRRGSIQVLSNEVNSRTAFATLQAPTNIITGQSYRLIIRNLASPAATVNVQFFVTTVTDSDVDGLPDFWEAAYGLNLNSSSDRDADADGDGMTNYEEYLADTNPTNALSLLAASISTGSNHASISFEARSNKTYSVQYSPTPGGSWLTLGDVVSRTNNRVEAVLDPGNNTNRFYRVVTPRQ